MISNFREYVKLRNRLSDDLEALTDFLETEGLELPKRTRVPKRKRVPKDDPRDRIPGGPPSIPEPDYPTPREVEWVVTEGRALHVAGGVARAPQETLENPIHWILQNHASPEKPITIGVRGKLSSGLVLCGHGSQYGLATGYRQMPDGSFADLYVRLVGLDEEAEVRGVRWGAKRGNVLGIELHSLLVRCPKGSKSPIMDEAEAGEVVIKGCGVLPDSDHPDGFNGTGMMWGMALSHGSKVRYVADCFRAKENGVPVRFKEHWGYNKGGGLRVYCRNDISGGNRTGLQERAPGTHPRPYGPLLVEGNYSEDGSAGFDYLDGGARITVWESPDAPVVIKNNRITEETYKCLTLSQQPKDQDPYFTDEGYAHKLIWIEGNEFRSRHDSLRSTASLASIESLHIAGGNVWSHPAKWELTLDAQFAYKMGAKQNKCVQMYSGNDIPKVMAYQGQADVYVPVDQEKLMEARCWL